VEVRVADAGGVEADEEFVRSLRVVREACVVTGKVA